MGIESDSESNSSGYSDKLASDPDLNMTDGFELLEACFTFSSTRENAETTKPLLPSVSGVRAFRHVNLISNSSIAKGSNDFSDNFSSSESSMMIDEHEPAQATISDFDFVNSARNHSFNAQDAPKFAFQVTNRIIPTLRGSKKLDLNKEDNSFRGERYSQALPNIQKSFGGHDHSVLEFDSSMSEDATINNDGSISSNWTTAACTAACAGHQKVLEERLDYLVCFGRALSKDIKERDRVIETKLFDIKEMEFSLNETKGELAFAKRTLEASELFAKAAYKDKQEKIMGNHDIYTRIGQLEHDAKLRRPSEEAAAANISSALVQDLRDRLTKTDVALDHALACNTKHLDRITILQAASEDEEGRRKGLESHIVDMGRRKYLLKQQNRQMRLELESREPMEIERIRQINMLTAKIDAQELEIKQWQNQHSDIMRRTMARREDTAGQ